MVNILNLYKQNINSIRTRNKTSLGQLTLISHLFNLDMEEVIKEYNKKDLKS